MGEPLKLHQVAADLGIVAGERRSPGWPAADGSRLINQIDGTKAS
jgi:hypothetical protein